MVVDSFAGFRGDRVLAGGVCSMSRPVEVGESPEGRRIVMYLPVPQVRPGPPPENEDSEDG